MVSDNLEHQNKNREQDMHQKPKSPLPFPFEIQLVDAFPTEIIARRFPVSVPEGLNLSVAVNFSLENRHIDEENLLAQVVLAVKVDFPTEPRLYEISFGILGLFRYQPPYTAEMVYAYLENGPLSILLPLARELLASLCMRIRVPLLYIPMYPIVPPESRDN
jgi:preprotein translocase subunit SecB